MAIARVPLFPLSTVLFPQAVLALRIFEPRYLSMVSACMRNESEFGVVLITQGGEVGGAAQFHQIGTLARIVDFDQLDDGYLGISCHGGQRFTVLEHAIGGDLLVHAKVEILTDKTKDQPNLPQDFSSMKAFMRDLMKRDEFKQWVKTIEPQWDSPLWLSYRLSELLPLSMQSRQSLLEIPLSERLSQLSKIMRQLKLI